MSSEKNAPCTECLKRGYECAYVGGLQLESGLSTWGAPGLNIDEVGNASDMESTTGAGNPASDASTAAHAAAMPSQTSHLHASFYSDSLKQLSRSGGSEDLVELLLLRFVRSGDFIAALRDQPYQATFESMALIYGCITLALIHCDFLQQTGPGGVEPSRDNIQSFLNYCRECLHHSISDTPGDDKVEAKILYCAAILYYEHNLGRAFAALGEASALAEASGYRDSPYSKTHAGQMRARACGVLDVLYYYAAFYLGRRQTPSLHSFQGSTAILNIPNSHSTESTLSLSSPQPLEQWTPALPIIFLCRLARISSTVGLEIFKGASVTRQLLMDFEAQIEDVYQKIPETIVGDQLKATSLSMMARIVYSGAILVLYRRSMFPPYIGRPGQEWNHFRRRCILAAVDIVHIQGEFVENVQSENRWDLSPLVSYDFLLATTVLCLEFSFLLSSPSIVEDGDWARLVIIEPAVLEERLRTCQAFWDLRDPSKIPTAATRVLTWVNELLMKYGYTELGLPYITPGNTDIFSMDALWSIESARMDPNEFSTVSSDSQDFPDVFRPWAC
ncbi:uncharacterized protein JN550_007914 [Neoarthrinium moseri]|uniref:uncharacterized protein n=1 Tax=Neoarthrinium moseri TaxID=1658444 RepID=UPI001FDC5BFB|nr:uncharacterized protein JN550_007914 [Neoarthrinium moseri]KAI1865936.1 hypothetical protein JN550_007914 [Neoarthrinium moseri]